MVYIVLIVEQESRPAQQRSLFGLDYSAPQGILHLVQLGDVIIFKRDSRTVLAAIIAMIAFI